MMTRRAGVTKQHQTGPSAAVPCLTITKLGIVSRDYTHKYANKRRDFSNALCDVLALLDREGCDAVLFSSYSIVPQQSFRPRACFAGLRNLRAIFLEEFTDGGERCIKRYVVHHRTAKAWKEYELCPWFGTLAEMSEKDMANFVEMEVPKRVMGTCCLVLCGEINGVKCSHEDWKVYDDYGLRRAIPEKASIILNPGHDRMTRFEMSLKRAYLSQRGRWVVSVWNKGKKHKDGKVRDGKRPPWTVFYNGKEITENVLHICNELDVEIGIFDFERS